MWVKDKAGHRVYVTYIEDCEPNKGGYYCETYTDDFCGHKIDDFCIHEGDCELTEKGIKEYIKNYYKNEVLDLNYEF